MLRECKTGLDSTNAGSAGSPAVKRNAQSVDEVAPIGGVARIFHDMSDYYAFTPSFTVRI
jgi:hypothetical protein